MKIEAGKFTMTGRRSENQDACAVIRCSQGIVAVVCDGLGGYAGGREAAKTAVKAVRGAATRWARLPLTGSKAFAPYLVDVADKAVRALHKDPNLVEAMTTIVLWILAFDTPTVCTVAYVGDSRAYRMNSEGTVLQLTEDHSFERHILAACLGSRSGPDAPNVRTLTCVPGDRFLLCSDGFHGSIDVAARWPMQAHFRPGTAAKKLSALAFASGSQDNITAVVLELRP